jgi:hypothetical protein
VGTENADKAGGVILVYCTAWERRPRGWHRRPGSGNDDRQHHGGGHGNHRRKTRDGYLRHRLAGFRRYQVAITATSGLSGSSLIVLTQGGVPFNPVAVPVQ